MPTVGAPESGILRHALALQAVIGRRSDVMNLERLIGRYLRLREELVITYSSLQWNSARIERLTHGIGSTEQEIRALRASLRHVEESAHHAA